MCDKKNYVLFTDTECLVLSPNFKLPDESHILLKIPRKDNMYSFDMKNIVPKESLTCLVAKATLDESMLWHRRLCHINFKNINKLVKDNIVRGLPTKCFENDQTCVNCLKGKQHRASCKSKVLNLITKPLFMLHMDLFGPTFDETSEILKNFIKEIENLVNKKVKIIRCDNETEFKNKVIDDFCREKGFFVGYSLSSKAFRVYNTRTIRVEENLHIGFLENKPMTEGNGPKWLFDIDSLTQSMNYVPIATGTITNEFVGGPDNENDEKDKSEDDSSPKEVNTARQHVNTTSPEVNTVSFKLNTINPSVSTASSNDQDIHKDMFKMGASHALEATHVEFFSDEDEPEVDLGNILHSYTVPTAPNTRIHKDHPIENVIGDVKSTVQIRRMTKPTSEQGFLNAVWIPLDLPIGKRVIGTKWVFRNKKYERGIVIMNKARLVAHGHRQEEGIDYEEVFASMARIEAIRLFLAYASFMGFLVYQMDVKSAFLYGTIEEEVYVTQPPGFKDPNHPDKVYKVVKALYGLHQALRAWYETLANYLLGNRFKRGKIDQTLFIKKQKGDILLVQVYVDDIIFGSTNKDLCTGFEKLMKDKFQMSSIGELIFFLGLQVQQKEDGIFISQDKYVAEILKKFNYTDVESASTLVDLENPLVKDGDANDVDVHLYRFMIGSLMYLTASRPDIMFVVCACARFQVTQKTSHLLAVKKIFRYLKGNPTLGLWYFRDSSFKLVAYTDSDYAGPTQDRNSTTGGCQFLGNRHVKRGQDTKIPQSSGPLVKVGDEAVHKELGDRMERAATTASSLEAEQDSGSGPRCQDTILGDVDAQTKFETTSKQSNDPPLSRGYTLGSGEDSITRTSVEDSVAPTTIEEITLAQTLIQIKAAKPKVVTTAATTTTTTRPKARGVVVQEPSKFKTPQESQPSMIKDKGKAIMIETEVPLKRKDQVALDEDLARNLQAQLEAKLIEEERLARKKEEEANIALIESWDNIQAMMEAYFELARRLQTEEQGDITIKERSRLFVELMNKRKKHFPMLRAEEKRRKPPTKAQKRNPLTPITITNMLTC
ncbi:putative ribonuclease H-like domain-containing protein [Tanacetum coccineum]